MAKEASLQFPNQQKLTWTGNTVCKKPKNNNRLLPTKQAKNVAKQSKIGIILP